RVSSNRCSCAVSRSLTPAPRFSFLMLPPPPISTLFPYTTLFRSHESTLAFALVALPEGERGEFGGLLLDDAPQISRRVRLGEGRSEEHTSELQSRFDLVCRLLLEKKKSNIQ